MCPCPSGSTNPWCEPVQPNPFETARMSRMEPACVDLESRNQGPVKVGDRAKPLWRYRLLTRMSFFRLYMHRKARPQWIGSTLGSRWRQRVCADPASLQDCKFLAVLRFCCFRLPDGGPVASTCKGTLLDGHCFHASARIAQSAEI